MKLQTKRTVIGLLGLLFLVSLILVQALEVQRRRQESGQAAAHVAIPVSSSRCVECHGKSTPGIIDHWEGSTHAVKGVGCVECHQAQPGDVDGFDHYGAHIATIVTPKDCSRCHKHEYEEFEHSHHAKGGNILASLDNFLAEKVEGFRDDTGGLNFFNPHSPTPGMVEVKDVNGLASAVVGCLQCHGSKVALLGKDGSRITLDQLNLDADGKATNTEAITNIDKTDEGRPKFHPDTWPNTGIGRINLDGSLGSCSACHSRHDFSPRRARQPENCGKCHLGPDHPQKEIYEESKHGVAFRDLKDHMNLDAHNWVLGEDYTQAPTCATCHMSGNTRNGGKVTHDPGTRISWTNRPPVSLVMDTNADGKIISEADPVKRKEQTVLSAEQRRTEMRNVCTHCHTPDYVTAFYKQYDDFVILYNEKFAKPGQAIMAELSKQGLLTKEQFDEEIEWTWFYLWHHEGRRARHGASMMAPDYAHWHGMYEVAERFYMELIPQARELAEHAEEEGKSAEAESVRKVIEEIMSRKEHQWGPALKPKAKKPGAATGEASAATSLPAIVPANSTAESPTAAATTPAAADKPADTTVEDKSAEKAADEKPADDKPVEKPADEKS